jgi:hypothetical protein
VCDAATRRPRPSRRRQRGPQPIRVLEPLEVARDHLGVVVVGEVLHEVSDVEVDLVAGGHPAGEGDAEQRALNDRAALMAALRQQPDLPAPVCGHLRHDLERVGVRVRPHDADPVLASRLAEPPLMRGTILAHLAEPGGEDQRIADALRPALGDDVCGDRRRSADHRQVDGLRDVEHRAIDGYVAERAPGRIDQKDAFGAVPAAMFVENLRCRAASVDAADDGDSVRREESFDVLPYLRHQTEYG